MTTETIGELTDEPVAQPSKGRGKRKDTFVGKSPMQIAFARLRRDKVAIVCFFVVLFFAICAIFADLLMKLFGVSTDTVRPIGLVDPLRGGLPLKGPPNNGFDPEHPFGIAPGTAVDNLAFWLKGCQTSLMIASLSTVVAALIGITVGLIAGFAGGIVDKVLSFFIDFFLTLPFLLGALTLAPVINERFADQANYATIQRWALIGVLAFFSWMSLARLIRGEVLSLREREFIQAARVLGMPTRRILFKELLPNLTAPIVVFVSLTLPAAVAAEAGLAFLGIGVTDGKSWGQIIANAVRYFETYPLYLYEPLIGVVGLVVALNLLGDAIRDAVDPKTRR